MCLKGWSSHRRAPELEGVILGQAPTRAGQLLGRHDCDWVTGNLSVGLYLNHLHLLAVLQLDGLGLPHHLLLDLHYLLLLGSCRSCLLGRLRSLLGLLSWRYQGFGHQ